MFGETVNIFFSGHVKFTYSIREMRVMHIRKPQFMRLQSNTYSTQTGSGGSLPVQLRTAKAPARGGLRCAIMVGCRCGVPASQKTLRSRRDFLWYFSLQTGF